MNQEMSGGELGLGELELEHDLVQRAGDDASVKVGEQLHGQHEYEEALARDNITLLLDNGGQ